MKTNEERTKAQKLFGFKQEELIKITKMVTEWGRLKTICADIMDAAILQWAVNLLKSPISKKITVDGTEYVWIKHGYLAESFPLLGITPKTAGERLKKLVMLDLLTHHLVKEGGTFSYYGLGENYYKLTAVKDKEGIRPNADGVSVATDNGMRHNGNGDTAETEYGGSRNGGGGAAETDNKDINIENNNIKNRNKKIDCVNTGEPVHTDASCLNESYIKFINDFSIKTESCRYSVGKLDFDKLYDAYVESANFLQKETQAKYLSWIYNNYEKIIDGYYKDKAIKPKAKSNYDILREVYQQTEAEEKDRKRYRQ